MTNESAVLVEKERESLESKLALPLSSWQGQYAPSLSRDACGYSQVDEHILDLDGLGRQWSCASRYRVDVILP